MNTNKISVKAHESHSSAVDSSSLISRVNQILGCRVSFYFSFIFDGCLPVVFFFLFLLFRFRFIPWSFFTSPLIPLSRVHLGRLRSDVQNNSMRARWDNLHSTARRPNSHKYRVARMHRRTQGQAGQKRPANAQNIHKTHPKIRRRIQKFPPFTHAGML